MRELIEQRRKCIGFKTSAAGLIRRELTLRPLAEVHWQSYVRPLILPAAAL
jgi:hypothetical protein